MSSPLGAQASSSPDNPGSPSACALHDVRPLCRLGKSSAHVLASAAGNPTAGPPWRRRPNFFAQFGLLLADFSGKSWKALRLQCAG